MIDDTIENGGPGSGNFGHAGRPGKVGGSAPYEKGYSKPKREAGQKLREAIAPEREKARQKLKALRDLYRQKSKEHLAKYREQYRQEYKDKKAQLEEQFKRQLKLDKEGMYTGMKKPDKQEVKTKMAELKQQYKDYINKQLFQQKINYRDLIADIKQEDKEKYKKLYQEQKTDIMSKYKEEALRIMAEMEKPIAEKPIQPKEEKKTNLKLLGQTNKKTLIEKDNKKIWIPNRFITKNNTLTPSGQKLLEQAPTKEEFDKERKIPEKKQFYIPIDTLTDAGRSIADLTKDKPYEYGNSTEAVYVTLTSKYTSNAWGGSNASKDVFSIEIPLKFLTNTNNPDFMMISKDILDKYLKQQKGNENIQKEASESLINPKDVISKKQDNKK